MENFDLVSLTPENEIPLKTNVNSVRRISAIGKGRVS